MNEKIVLFDVGARGGINQIIPGWLPNARFFKSYADFFDCYAFEPDKEEASVLKNTGAYREVYDQAIGANTGEMTLFITKEPDKSSTLEPDVSLLLESFGGDAEGYKVDRKVCVSCKTLDDIAQEIGVYPDWIKIDTQGSELDIIEGSPKSFHHATVLLLELSSISQYKGQRSTAQAIAYLNEFGFDIVATNYKPDAPYENDMVFIKRLVNRQVEEKNIRSAALCMSLFGLDQQMNSLLIGKQFSRFRRVLGVRRKLASLHYFYFKFLKKGAYLLPDTLKKKLRAIFRI